MMLFISSCSTTKSKTIEVCVIYNNGELYCRDNRISDKGYERENKYAVEHKYLCTNPDDFQSIIGENLILNNKENP